MSKIQSYIIATRPWSFPVSTMSVLVTAAGLYYAGYPVNWWYALWAVVGILLFHASSNAWSDYFDYKAGVDREDTFGSKTLTTGILTPKQEMTWASILLAIACINGLAMYLVSGWQLLAVGVVGALLSVFYPWLKFHALGDLDILLEYGILPALGTGFFVTGAWCWDALWYTPAFVTITIAVLHANNTRDIAPDGRAEIKTFAMLLGQKVSIWLYDIEVCIPIAWTLAMCLVGKMPWLSMLVVITLKPIIDNCRLMHNLPNDSHAIDRLDEFTSKHQMLNSAILILTMVIAHLFL